MAFSTQKNFMKLLLHQRRCESLEPENKCSADIKHYFACHDARAWSINASERNQYLTDVITSCQDNITPKCKAGCFCESELECQTKKGSKYDESDIMRFRNKTEKNLSKTSNTVHKNVYGAKTDTERVNIKGFTNRQIRREADKTKPNKHLAQSSNETQYGLSEKYFTDRDKINERKTKEESLESDLQMQQNEKELLPINESNAKEKEFLRQNENEKVMNELLHATSSSDDREGSIEIFKLSDETNVVLPDEYRETDSNESNISEASYDVPRPVSLRPPIGNLLGDGDCEKRRHHIREMIRIKGEETLSELMLILHNYEQKFEYYKKICQDRKAQIQNPGTNSLLRKRQSTHRAFIGFAPNVEQLEKQTDRKRVARNVPTANAWYSQHTLSSLKQPSMGHIQSQLSAREITNHMTQGYREATIDETFIGFPSRPAEEHPHEDLFFHKPNSALNFQNAKKSIDAAKQAIGVLNNIDVYSEELVGAVRKLTQVIQEFTNFKDTLRRVLQAGRNQYNQHNQPSQMAGSSGLHFNRHASVNRKDWNNSSTPVRKISERLLERKAAGGNDHCGEDQDIAKAQNVLSERGQYILTEIQQRAAKHKRERQNLYPCKEKCSNILKTHHASIKSREHIYRIRSERGKKWGYIADIDADFDAVNVTGFAKHSSKRRISKNVVPSSQSMICYDVGVDLHVDKLPIVCCPAEGKMKNIVVGNIAKMQNQVELISDQIAYKTMVTNSQLQTEDEALKEKQYIEKSVLKLCRKIRALEAKALKIKTSIMGHEKIIYNPFEQFCAKRTLKRIQDLQLNLRKIRATSEFKHGLLQAARDAKYRREQQNENLKQDINLARKTIEELEDHIKKFQSVVCSEVHHRGKCISQRSLSSHPPAKIVKPLPPEWHCVEKSSFDFNESIIGLKKRKVPQPYRNDESFVLYPQVSRTVRSNTPSETYQHCSRKDSVSSEQPYTSEIEIEITPTIISPIEQAPSIIVVKSPVKMYSSDSFDDETPVMKVEKLSVNKTQDSSVKSTFTGKSSKSLIAPGNADKTDGSLSEHAKMVSKTLKQKSTMGGCINTSKVSIQSEENTSRIPKKEIDIKSVFPLIKKTVPTQHGIPCSHVIQQNSTTNKPKDSAATSELNLFKVFRRESFQNRIEDHVKIMHDSTKIVDKNNSSKTLKPGSSNILKKTNSKRLKVFRVSSVPKTKSRLSNMNPPSMESVTSTFKENSLVHIRPNRECKEHSAWAKSLSSTRANQSDGFNLRNRASRRETITTSRKCDSESTNEGPTRKIVEQQKYLQDFSTESNEKFTHVSVTSLVKSFTNEHICEVEVEKEVESVPEDNENVSLSYITTVEQINTTSQMENKNKSKINGRILEKSFSCRDLVEVKNLEFDQTEEESNLQSSNKSLKNRSTFFDTNRGEILPIKQEQRETIVPHSTENGEKFLETVLKSSKIFETIDSRRADINHKIMKKNSELQLNPNTQVSTNLTRKISSQNSQQTTHLKFNTTTLDEPQHSQRQPKSGISTEFFRQTIKIEKESVLPGGILQKQKEHPCRDHVNEVEDLKLELSALKQKNQQLYKDELFHKNHIEELEEKLSTAKHIDRFQINVETAAAEKDIAQAHERQQSKNLNYQQRIIELQSNLVKCQEELTRLERIHSNCPPLKNASNQDCSQWEKCDRIYRVKIETLEKKLIQKDEQLKRLRAKSDLPGMEEKADNFKSMWLTCEAELRTCKKAIESINSGQNIKVIKELTERLLQYEQENKRLNEKLIHVDKQVSNLGQRLFDTIQNFSQEKRTSSKLRKKLEEYETKFKSHQGNQNFHSRTMIPVLDLVTNSEKPLLDRIDSSCYNEELPERSCARLYLSHLQTSVQELLLQLILAMKNYCPNIHGTKNSKCLCNDDNIRTKIRQIYNCVNGLETRNQNKAEFSACAKKTRLEKICAKILQKGIHNLNWDELTYLHRIVYKTGCAVRGFNSCEKTRGQGCGDVVQNNDSRRISMKKTAELECEVSRMQNLILLIKQGYHHF